MEEMVMATKSSYKWKHVHQGSLHVTSERLSGKATRGMDIPARGESCSNLIGQPNAIAKWELIASNGFFRVANAAPTYNAVKFHDPIQGHADDCHFIAALSSLAWCKPDKIIKTVENGFDKFNFYDPVSKTTKSVKVTEKLPKDAAGALIFATCSTASPAGESWPMVYEKAYAAWLQNVTNDLPNIAGLGGGNPLTAVQNITGWTTVATYETATADIATMLKNSNVVNQTTGKSIWPMAAWTQAGNAGAKIYANHSYSILGCHFDANKQPDYIVMREPYGGKMPEPIADADVVKVGNWNGIDLTKTNPPDGVFALRTAKFKGYFWKFGYVMSP